MICMYGIKQGWAVGFMQMAQQVLLAKATGLQWS